MSTTQAVKIVGNAMQRNVTETVLISTPERAILERAGFSSVLANTKREEFLLVKRRENIIFLSSNHLEKKPQVGILNT